MDSLCLYGDDRLGYEGQGALSLCLHGDGRPGYEGQGALTQFMFTWRWQTWL